MSASITAGTDATYNVEFSEDTLDDAFFGQGFQAQVQPMELMHSPHMLTEQTLNSRTLQ